MAYLNLIRYKNLIIIVLLQILLRYGLLIPILNHFGVSPELSHLRFGLLVLATVLLAASGYVINNYFDVSIDRINKPDNVVVGRQVPRRTALLLHVIFTFTGVFIGLFLAYITRKENYALMFILIPGLLWYYSTTLKKQMLVGNLTIALLTALVPFVVVSIEFATLARVHGSIILQSEACSTAWFWTTGFAFFAFISTLMRELIKDMEDVEGDREAGCRTLPVEMGIDYSRSIVVILSIASVAALWLILIIVPQLRSSLITIGYFALFLTIPYVVLALKTLTSKTKKDFAFISGLSKIIMLMGILFIIVARTFFV
ncbi:4-hydroxybenzoate polyprenyltransferase [Marinilabilia salmonicolor]|jgi:4-hydroxybenzoate polyprenyltransferase|uniref:geranylgeranylglycerol-phosphate geranylgeranyltransferase n=1 Tax=Marinilabilia salmonicolor TaxID=989 RepID=UPI000D075597|nr:geranylgeranylglycerol-phosphate geranylgeranyltransferase [Marinilabilia salmonicolor]PRY91947.1 4-hydroxybenzoate polyprenyltransferase [Marinilabilia salmonicolor]